MPAAPYTPPPEERYSFLDDYSEGAHPQLLQALVSSNLTQQVGYGNDSFSSEARESIRRLVGCPDAGVYFVPTGTSANVISIAACLRPHEAVIAASSGHIVTRETGAVEASGHKIINVVPENGKLTPITIKKALEENWHFPHMAVPKLVYISNATEIGTLYTKSELRAIKQLCVESGLILFVDGARIGAALASELNDLSLPELLELTDIFWIGGTKNGALLGEAVVVKDPTLARDFEFYVKQRGSLLAKGRAIGAQFAELFRLSPEHSELSIEEQFRKTLYFDLAKRANTAAQTLSVAIKSAGYSLRAETETNQVFAVLPMGLIERLKEHFRFYVWETLDEGQAGVVRLLTTWATDLKQLEQFVELVKTPL
jgi:threonine aldolase